MYIQQWGCRPQALPAPPASHLASWGSSPQELEVMLREQESCRNNQVLDGRRRGGGGAGTCISEVGAGSRRPREEVGKDLMKERSTR